MIFHLRVGGRLEMDEPSILSDNRLPTNVKPREYRSLSNVKVQHDRIVPRAQDLAWSIRNEPHSIADLVNVCQFF